MRVEPDCFHPAGKDDLDEAVVERGLDLLRPGALGQGDRAPRRPLTPSEK
jgi:hypothetical protein